MTTTPTTLKQYLYLYTMQLTTGVVLLDLLKHTKPIQRGMALGISTSDEIRKRLDTADETEQKAMIVASRDNLTKMRGLVMAAAFPMQAAKARREWVEGTRQLLNDTAQIGKTNV